MNQVRYGIFYVGVIPVPHTRKFLLVCNPACVEGLGVCTNFFSEAGICVGN